MTEPEGKICLSLPFSIGQDLEVSPRSNQKVAWVSQLFRLSPSEDSGWPGSQVLPKQMERAIYLELECLGPPVPCDYR